MEEKVILNVKNTQILWLYKWRDLNRGRFLLLSPWMEFHCSWVILRGFLDSWNSIFCIPKMFPTFAFVMTENWKSLDWAQFGGHKKIHGALGCFWLTAASAGAQEQLPVDSDFVILLNLWFVLENNLEKISGNECIQTLLVVRRANQGDWQFVLHGRENLFFWAFFWC